MFATSLTNVIKWANLDIHARFCKIWMIRNPKSGRGAGTRLWSELAPRLQPKRDTIHVVSTEYPGHATLLAKEAVGAGAEIVVACGGDGTITEVLNGIVGTDATLGIVPMGTGNDISRHLGIGQDIQKAWDTIEGGTTALVDVGVWNCSGREGFFINVLGCGFDAVVARRINEGFRALRGTYAYIAAVIVTLLKHKAVTMFIQVDQEKHETSAMLCSVANSSSYGGGMLISPHSSLTDEHLDVVVVGNVSRLEFLRTFPKVFKGTHLSHPKVTHAKGSTISIDCQTAQPVLADGEIVGETPVRCHILPHHLKLLVPLEQLERL